MNYFKYYIIDQTLLIHRYSHNEMVYYYNWTMGTIHKNSILSKLIITRQSGNTQFVAEFVPIWRIVKEMV